MGVKKYCTVQNCGFASSCLSSYSTHNRKIRAKLQKWKRDKKPNWDWKLINFRYSPIMSNRRLWRIENYPFHSAIALSCLIFEILTTLLFRSHGRFGLFWWIYVHADRPMTSFWQQSIWQASIHCKLELKPRVEVGAEILEPSCNYIVSMNSFITRATLC